MSTRTATLERAFSPRIELPNSYTLKSGQLEWFQCDVNSRGSKNEMIKLVRASDNGVLLQIPTQSSNPNDPPYHTFELRADNVGSMPILKHCSNSIVNRISGFTGIQSRYKKGLLICIKNPNDTWSSIVLCQREDKLNSDTDPEKWRDTIVNELFTTKSYKSDFQLMCGADKFTVHWTEKFISLVPECQAFRKREKLIDYCLTIKENIWSRQNFYDRACKQQEHRSFSIKNSSGRVATYRIISNDGIEYTMDNLREYVQGPPAVIPREPSNRDSPIAPPRAVPTIPQIAVPGVNPNSSCAPASLDSRPAFFILPQDELIRPVGPKVSPRPRKKLVKSESQYQTYIQEQMLPVPDPVYQSHKRKKIELTRRITAEPHSQRLTKLIQPIPTNLGEPASQAQSREGRFFAEGIDQQPEDIDQEFESTYDYRGFNDVRPRDHVNIAHNTSIDMTLYEILQKVPHSRNHLRTMKHCDIGLGTSRIPFVLRLEMADWKNFAHEVFGELMGPPDYDLLEEFACRMAIPPVEIVLIHWKRLHDINDGSISVARPCVEVIRDILTKLDFLDIRDIIPDQYDSRMPTYPTL